LDDFEEFLNEFEKEQGSGFSGWNKEDEERRKMESELVAETSLDVDFEGVEVQKYYLLFVCFVLFFIREEIDTSPGSASNRVWTVEDEEREIENLKKSLLAVAVLIFLLLYYFLFFFI
jgi:hypothetical protein